MKANASGLLIWGDVGTGKSFFAGCIANALLEKGIPVLMTNFSRILNTLTGMHFEDRNQFINSLNRYSLLIIDDLGIERNSDFALEQVFNVKMCIRDRFSVLTHFFANRIIKLDTEHFCYQNIARPPLATYK